MSRVEWLANLEMPVRNRSRTAIILIVGVLALLVGVFVCVWWDWVLHLWCWLSTVPPNRESASTTIRNVGLVIGAIIGIGLANRRIKVADHQVETSERGLLNERYQKGAEMLGSKILAVRLGGIYALQGLAEEHAEQYHVQIMRLFCAFVRHPTEDKDDTAKSTDVNETSSTKLDRIREDVQAAMTAIGTRSDADIALEKKEGFKPNLNGAILPGTILQEANLTNANLFGANLTDANLFGANLIDANLFDAKLTGANLYDATLTDATLTEANLTNAKLSRTKLTGVDLTDATLTDANLTYAKLTNAKLLGANLTNAKLFGTNLTDAKLLGANLTDANLLGADLTDANLTDANLTDADLTNTKLIKTKGLTQDQLNKACADPQRPPELQDVFDAKTGVPLAWEQSASP